MSKALVVVGEVAVNRHVAGRYLQDLVTKHGREWAAAQFGVSTTTIGNWMCTTVPKGRCADIGRLHRENFDA